MKSELLFVLIIFFGGFAALSIGYTQDTGITIPPFGNALELADKALCFIYVGAGNYSCNTVDDSITFIAGNGMDINANFTGNTITFNSSAASMIF